MGVVRQCPGIQRLITTATTLSNVWSLLLIPAHQPFDPLKNPQIYRCKTSHRSHSILPYRILARLNTRPSPTFSARCNTSPHITRKTNRPSPTLSYHTEPSLEFPIFSSQTEPPRIWAGKREPSLDFLPKLSLPYMFTLT